MVVGNHPHWYQHIEWVDNKPIFYALGNFIFDQEWSQETKVGYLAKLQFAGSEVVKNKSTIEKIRYFLKLFIDCLPIKVFKKCLNVGFLVGTKINEISVFVHIQN